MSNALTFKTLYICWDLVEWFLFLITDGCETTFRTCYFCELNQWAYQGNPDKGTLLLWNNLNCFLYILSPFDYIFIGNLCLQSVHYRLLKKKTEEKSTSNIFKVCIHLSSFKNVLHKTVYSSKPLSYWFKLSLNVWLFPCISYAETELNILRKKWAKSFKKMQS